MDGAQHFKRVFRVGNWITKQRCFIGAWLVVIVSWSGIPGGGYNALVIFDHTFLNNHPVGQHAARRFMEAHTLGLAWPGGGFPTLGVGHLIVAGGDVGGDGIAALDRHGDCRCWS